MFKFGSMCLVTSVLCAAGGALAADGAKPGIPVFATTPNNTGLGAGPRGRPRRPPSSLLVADRDPSHSTEPIPMCPTHPESNLPIALPIFPIRSCRSG